MLRLRTQQALPLLPHKQYDKAQLFLAAGKRGFGKTYALQHYVETREPRVLLLDPFNDFRRIQEAEDWQEALDDLSDGEPCRRRVRPPVSRDSMAYADAFFDAAIDQLRDCLLVLDEMSLWSQMRETDALRILILQGRRLGLRLCVGCQRIALVPGVMLSEATEMLIFRTRRPRDLDVLEEWTNSEAREIAPKLTVGECLLFDDL